MHLKLVLLLACIFCSCLLVVIAAVLSLQKRHNAYCARRHHAGLNQTNDESFTVGLATPTTHITLTGNSTTLSGGLTYIASASSAAPGSDAYNAFTTTTTNPSMWSSASNLYNAPSPKGGVVVYTGKVSTSVTVVTETRTANSVEDRATDTAFEGEWVQLQFPQAVNATTYKIVAPQGQAGVTSWVLAGSPDGSWWMQLDGRTTPADASWTPGQAVTYVMDNPYPLPFTYMRLICLATSGASTSVSVGSLLLLDATPVPVGLTPKQCVDNYLALRTTYGWVPRSVASQPAPAPTLPAVAVEAGKADGPPDVLLPLYVGPAELFTAPFSDIAPLFPSYTTGCPPCLGYVNPSPVRNQGGEGSCVGHATSAMREFHARLYQHASYYLSPQFIYDVAGPNISSAMSCLQDYGVCPETDCPVDTQEFDGSCPDSNLNRQEEHAVSFAIDSCYTIATHQEARMALFEIGPIVFGVIAYLSSDTATAGTFWQPLSEIIGGGHCLCIDSYDDGTQTFSVRNSWGPTAPGSDKGYFRMSYSDFDTYGFCKYVMLPKLPPPAAPPAPAAPPPTTPPQPPLPPPPSNKQFPRRRAPKPSPAARRTLRQAKKEQKDANRVATHRRREAQKEVRHGQKQTRITARHVRVAANKEKREASKEARRESKETKHAGTTTTPAHKAFTSAMRDTEMTLLAAVPAPYNHSFTQHRMLGPCDVKPLFGPTRLGAGGSVATKNVLGLQGRYAPHQS